MNMTHSHRAVDATALVSYSRVRLNYLVGSFDFRYTTSESRVKISATIIVRNEEDNIAAVCETVSWADEIVIVDSDSTDRTVEIARRYTDRIFNREFRGYRDKHEFADAQATGDWIFWIDADERLTDELRGSIEKLRHQPLDSLPDGFRIARRTSYLGRWIKHSGWYPDLQMRLYRKAASHWDGVAPHETARVDGRVETLNGELLHYTVRSLSEHHRRAESYATLAAEYHHTHGKQVGCTGLFFYPIAAFLRTYVLKLGFLDGVQGLIIAMFTAYGVFLRYANLWERNRKV
jgi:glycosyltransferase involved in cell wall biosynthesis